jgi:predicted nicotinamide N-methyase
MTFVARVLDAPGGALTVFESGDVDADLNAAIDSGGPTPYGRVTWPSALVVARALAALPLRGRRVMELGCGTGVCALVAARAGADVTATDVDDFALAAVRRAAALVWQLRAVPFDVAGAAPLPPTDVLVAADLLYEEALCAATARRVIEARRTGAVAVVGCPGRVFRGRFVGLLADAGLAAAFDADGVCVVR